MRTRTAGLVTASLACLALSPWPACRQGHHVNDNEFADLVFTSATNIRIDLDPYPTPSWHQLTYIGNGSGTFALVAVADVDGDGNEDLILQGESTYRLTRMQGTVALGQAFLPRGDTSFGAAGDVDCDGDADLILNGPTLSHVLLMDGLEPRETVYVANGGGEYPITLLADVDGDWCEEAVAEGISSGLVRILDLSPRSGAPESLYIAKGDGYALVGTGDANGDLKADLFFDGPTHTRIDLMNGLAGRLASGWVGNGNGAYPVKVLGDFDGDGKTDLAADGESAARITLLDGTVAAGHHWLGSGGLALVQAADYDGDGRDDLAFWTESRVRIDVDVLNPQRYMARVFMNLPYSGFEFFR